MYEMAVSTSELGEEPFGLKIGDNVDCRVRAQNSNGWSQDWSLPNESTLINGCSDSNKNGAKGGRNTNCGGKGGSWKNGK